MAWQREHGRHTLPWQGTRDPYRVWLSEIMLQQTQVVTVLGYYARFLTRFPDVRALASGELDEVLALWSGLGYYSRARNLHRCAQEVVAAHDGQFPRSAVELQRLPGIGPSTAAAIAAFCFEERAAILDGNVKRVLSRLLAFDGDLSSGPEQRRLWQHATDLLPGPSDGHEMPAYTQALMDLGASICLPRRPACSDCPVHDICGGTQSGEPESFPVKSRRLRRTSEALWLLLLQREDGALWLHKRPPRGIWASLYCLPVFGTDEELKAILPEFVWSDAVYLEPRKHSLTHKDLHLHTVVGSWPHNHPAPDIQGTWFGAAAWQDLGLPAPIRQLLGEVARGSGVQVRGASSSL